MNCEKHREKDKIVTKLYDKSYRSVEGFIKTVPEMIRALERYIKYGNKFNLCKSRDETVIGIEDKCYFINNNEMCLFCPLSYRPTNYYEALKELGKLISAPYFTTADKVSFILNILQRLQPPFDLERVHAETEGNEHLEIDAWERHVYDYEISTADDSLCLRHSFISMIFRDNFEYSSPESKEMIGVIADTINEELKRISG